MRWHLGKSGVYLYPKTHQVMSKTAKAHVRFNHKDRPQFYPTLKARVDQYFIDNKLSPNYNATMVVKTVVMLTAYFLPFALLLAFQPSFGVSMALWSVMGLAIAGVGMSVMHDANHGAYSSNETVNYLLGHTLNFLGGSVFNWKLQHNIQHHTYTNIIDMDDDIADKLVLRFSPHTQVKKYHKMQFVYAFFFYGILTLYWTLLKDFIQFDRYTKTGVNTNKPKDNVVTLIKIILSKIAYFLFMFALPVFVFNIPFVNVLIGFLIMHFIAGLVLTVVFQLAHTVEGTSHPVPNAEGSIENNWAIHQMNTTLNFSRKSKLISWYLGGLNFQVEHHLFPRICHVHYPALAPIVKATAEEFGVPYLENETFMEALRSHVATLQRFGKLPNINEALG